MGFKLTGGDGSVAIDGQVITVTRKFGEQAGKPILLAAQSISGVTVHLEPAQGRFTLHYLPDSSPDADAPPAELLTIQFAVGAKEWWDAMATSIMSAVRKSALSSAKTAGESAEKPAAGSVHESVEAELSLAEAFPAAVQIVAGWVNRVLGKPLE